MQHVDALSRNTNILIIETNSFKDTLVICQAKDDKLKDIRKKLEKTEDKIFEMMVYFLKRIVVLCARRNGRENFIQISQ